MHRPDYPTHIHKEVSIMPTTNIADLDLDIPAEKLILDEVVTFYVMPFVVDKDGQVSPAYPNEIGRASCRERV